MTPRLGITADDLSRLPPTNSRVELVRGHLVVREPAGYRHGEIAARLLVAIATHAEAHSLGRVFAAETGFTIGREPDTVRAPDVAFVSNARLPDPPPVGFAELAPDLAVEVLSPDDRPGEVLQKVADWLEGGTRLIWVVGPVRNNARVFRADGTESIVDDNSVLRGEDVLPQFECSLSSVFRV